ncbi:unnamed protein product, partial [marine sediment metagenome]
TMIRVHDLTNSQVDEDFFREIARNVFKKEKVEEKIGLSIILVKPRRIRELNKKYKKENRTTDVLSFGQELNSRRLKFPSLPNENLELGDVVICLNEVKKNARKFNSDFKKELALVLIHGILHLLGYDHEKSDKEAKKMREKEKEYLKQTLNFKL